MATQRTEHQSVGHDPGLGVGHGPEGPGMRPVRGRPIYVSLPVADLQRSLAFFTELGFESKPEFTDDVATAIVISDGAFVMLLSRSFFAGFTAKDVAGPGVTEVTVALGVDSREEVDRLADKAVTLGGAPCREPQDHGFMYGRSFYDLDGHLWELIWSEPAVPAG